MKNTRFLPWGIAFLLILVIMVAFLVLTKPVSIHVRIAENGGFIPDHIKVSQGVPLRLRLVSDDVQHSFAVGQYPLEQIILEPGKPVEITLRFDESGTYTFYSTTPSSINFWRVRGTIEVTGDEPSSPVEPPLYVQLGLSLDDEHDDEYDDEHIVAEWTQSPSAQAGAAYEHLIPTAFLKKDFYILNSPMETFETLKDQPGLEALDDQEIWDIIAFIWQMNTSPQSLAEADILYQDNCAACHGISGKGDGQFAEAMNTISENNQDPHGIQAPTDFTSPEHLLEDQPVILQGLILRGGMGTGMPMWGSIFTDQQLWNLVAYLFAFQFK